MSEEAPQKSEVQESDEQVETTETAVVDPKIALLEFQIKQRDEKILRLESKLNDFDIKFFEARGFIKKMETEIEQIRSRADRDSQKQISQKLSDLCLKILPTVDMFDLSIQSAKDVKDLDSLLRGIEMVRSQFGKALTDLGLEKIQTENETFDPNLHEAVMNEVTLKSELDGKISRELNAGYRLGAQVVRPAQVAVFQFQEASA